MEENQRVKGSHAAYRSRVTRTFRKIDEIMEKEDPLPDPQVAKLTSMLEQLTQKGSVTPIEHTSSSGDTNTE